MDDDLHADKTWDKTTASTRTAVQITRFKSKSQDMKRVLIAAIDLGLRDQIIIKRIYNL